MTNKERYSQIGECIDQLLELGGVIYEHNSLDNIICNIYKQKHQGYINAVSTSIDLVYFDGRFTRVYFRYNKVFVESPVNSDYLFEVNYYDGWIDDVVEKVKEWLRYRHYDGSKL